MACLEARRDRELRVWLLARSLDLAGAGWVRVADLRVLASEAAGLSPRSVRRVLLAGAGMFWIRRGERLYLAGALRLAGALDCAAPRRVVSIPIDRFATLAAFRAACVDAFVAAGRGGARLISQSTMGALAGRTRQSISRYLRTAQVERHQNSVLTCRPPHLFDAHQRREGYYIGFVDGQRAVLRHLPATCISSLDSARFGQRRKSPRCSFKTRGRTTRVFYDDQQAAARALNRLRDGGAVFVALRRSDASGSALWHQYDGVFGRVLAA